MTLHIHPTEEDRAPASDIVDTVRQLLTELRRRSQDSFQLASRDLFIGCEIGLNNCLVVGAPEKDLRELCSQCDSAMAMFSQERQLKPLIAAHNACWDLFRKLTLREEVIEE